MSPADGASADGVDDASAAAFDGASAEKSASARPQQRLVVGRYRLRRLLGQGSMGTVWEAYDEFLHRPVAVKEVLLPPGVPQVEADELRERTLREARAIAVVSHPNVITLHDVAREQGEPFVVMEYMPARSLADLLRTYGPLEIPQAVTVGYAIAAGLGAAHQAGITHRDVKPGNVLIADDGRVKLTDFGISRNVSERTMTRTGIMLGSPSYMAPEVAAGREVTPAADLWGLGATLFAAVEGRAPYDPDGAVLETLAKVVHDEVPQPKSAGPLGEVIAALMVKDPAGRATLTEVRQLLHPLLPPPGTPLYTPGDEPKDPDGPDDSDEPEAPDGADAPTKAHLVAVAMAARSAPAATTPPAASAPLALDPGPLPFEAAARTRPARRRSLSTTLIVVVAVVLFCAAAGGGFALARVIGGQPIGAPRPAAPPKAVPAAPLGDLAITSGDAATLAGEQGGGFSVPVPRDWTMFVELRSGKALPNSSKVHFVSQDGTQQLTVERFPNFYPKYRINTYLAALRSASSRYDELGQTEIETVNAERESGQELVYRTTDVAPPAAPLNRQTFANLIPRGADLWVVGVTVPIEQEDGGRTKLFDKIIPEFKVTG